MHIPSGMIEGGVCPVTAVVATAGIGAAAWLAPRSEQKPGAVEFASVSAFVFAAQMMNFPIQSGTSGHLLGGVLASAVLGTPFGVLAIALVLAVQALLFSDGGLSVLGANVVNMSLVGAGLGGLLAGRWRGAGSLARIGFAAWVSVCLAALACAVELAISGAVPFAKSAPAMLSTHALIGLGEAAITVTALAVLPLCKGSSRPIGFAPGLAAVLIALLLTPFASTSPDGLEWVAGKLGFDTTRVPSFVAPLADYSLPVSAPGWLSTSLAGLAGVAAVFLLAVLVSWTWHSSRKA